jgi:hypothetical protein
LVIGRITPMWSISWSEPRRRLAKGPWPPKTRIGEFARQALATPVTPSVTPGPAVMAATPILPGLQRAQESAACTAACSWRTSTIRIPSSRQPS